MGCLFGEGRFWENPALSHQLSGSSQSVLLGFIRFSTVRHFSDQRFDLSALLIPKTSKFAFYQVIMMRCSAFTFIAVIVAIVAVVSGEETHDKDTKNDIVYIIIGIVVSLIVWSIVAVIGYKIANWTICACVLVVLFGPLGMCFAIFMPKRSRAD
uniref:Uncharacterized protein n=1 Tax=Plectus sambesii TaxID=2011161 RepID=A0A914X546_9BILA